MRDYCKKIVEAFSDIVSNILVTQLFPESPWYDSFDTFDMWPNILNTIQAPSLIINFEMRPPNFKCIDDMMSMFREVDNKSVTTIIMVDKKKPHAPIRRRNNLYGCVVSKLENFAHAIMLHP